MSTEFVPPLFKKFGKSLQDLFKEQFEYKKQLKLKTNTSSGVTLESGVEALSKGGDYAGNVKATWKQPEIGTFETELHTSGNTKYSVKAEKLSKGLIVKVSGDEKPAGKVEVDYAQEYFSSSLTVDVSKDVTAADAAGVVGYDGLSVGGQAKYDITAQKLVDFNAGAEYAQPDFTVTLKTSDQASKFGTSYYHKISSDITVGGLFSYDTEKAARVFTVGGQYGLGDGSFVKAKVDTNGIFATALEHRLRQPVTKFVLSTEFNTKSASTGPQNVGIALHLGDL